MRNQNFETPVTLELGSGGKRQIISHTTQAAHVLAERWPRENRGAKYRLAVKACADVLAQRVAASAGRKALVEAAREANILVPERKAPVFGRRGV